MPRLFLLLLLCLVGFAAPAFAKVTFDWAFIGNSGNAYDLNFGTQRGAVPYDFMIAKTEVTNSQYVEFLNAVASTDNFGGSDPTLYSGEMGVSKAGGIIRTSTANGYKYSVKPPALRKGPGGIDYTYGDKPVNYVSFFDAMRFVNWLSNGQGSGGTESGVYSIGDGLSETRNANTRFWIPSEDEWYKAAYHDSSAGTEQAYFIYATGSNETPNNNSPDRDYGNSANFYDNGHMNSDSYPFPFSDVGAYTMSPSPYGTFDQNGNAAEWTDTVIDSRYRGWQGGSAFSDWKDLISRKQGVNTPGSDGMEGGIRVSSAPPAVGDYNADGIVDTADYSFWTSHFGESALAGSGADGNRNGVIDAADYTVWRDAHEASLVSTAIPEPTSLALAAMLAGCGMMGRRSNR